MSQEAINFKQNHSNLDYSNMSLKELQKLPPYSGVIEFKISKTSFMMLNILNDDTSLLRFFWQGAKDINTLDLWYNISKKEGLYFDIGAHTGLFTLTALKSNLKNNIVSIEPYYLNMARMITNLRLNNLEGKAIPLMLAASNENNNLKFNISEPYFHLSKGGRIDDRGFDTKVIKLDSLDLKNFKKKIRGIKIDTEGEDFKVLQGAELIIKNHKPEIIIEVRNENKIDIQKFLHLRGYSIFDVNNLHETIDLQKINIERVVNIYAKQK